jgi:SAM-dependent methyltransferase
MLSANRFWTCTRWQPGDLNGKVVLEAGSGAGRFTEILLAAGANVVSFDYSSAVDANFANNQNDRLFLFQGDLYNIPLQKTQFDYVFCYGVLQHTPDAPKAFRVLLDFLKPGGKFSMDHYQKIRKPSPWSTPKYFWRPITRRMNPQTLLKIVQFYIPIWLPLDTAIKRIPRFGRKIAALVPIPCWNYLDQGLSDAERKEWAIMDTFDALAPAYDTPRTREEIAAWGKLPTLEDVNVFIGGNGVVINGKKRLDYAIA